MKSLSTPHFLVNVVDLGVVIAAFAMLIYVGFRAYLKYRQSHFSGGILIAAGLAVILYPQIRDLANRFIQLGPGANGVGFVSTLYSDAWYGWALSRLAFVLVVIGFVITELNRRRSEKHLGRNMGELAELRRLGSEADERFSHLSENTSSAVYCYKYDPPMPIDLPVDEQIKLSFDATLCHCNSVFASEFSPERAEDLMGRSRGLLDSGANEQTYREHFLNFIGNDYCLSDYEIRHARTRGRDRALRLNVTGVVNDGFLDRIWVVETDIMELRETEVALERRQTFLELVAWISSLLVAASDKNVDRLIEECVEEICSYFEADRSSILLLDEKNSRSALPAYRWGQIGEPAESSFSLDMYPDMMVRLEAGRPVRIDDISALRDDYSAERKELEKRGLNALLVLPMTVAEGLVGAMTIARYMNQNAWTDDDVQDAIIISELLANFVLRLKSHRQLAKALTGLRNATERLEAENVYLREEVEPKHGFTEIIGESSAVLRCLKLVRQVASTKTPVLIFGETGTGKELIARAIHNLSDRRDRPLVKINCAALPNNLIESELFGYEKGAFTGASGSKRGRFVLADKSTLFLDEFGEIPVELQAKLLRVLQEGEFEPLGGIRTVRVDVRILVATNSDLSVAVKEGKFRSDLYYRINTFPIELPALRDRGNDIDLLAEHFIKLHAQRLGRDIREISAEMVRQLRVYSWPGNIRELEGIIQRALISSSGPILELVEPLVPTTFADGTPKILSSSIADLKLVERDHIVSVLENTRWKISGETGAASQLGIPPSTLRSKMKKLKITRPD